MLLVLGVLVVACLAPEDRLAHQVFLVVLLPSTRPSVVVFLVLLPGTRPGQLVKSGCKPKGLNHNVPSSNHSTQAGGGLTHCTNSENMSHTGAFFCNNRAIPSHMQTT